MIKPIADLLVEPGQSRYALCVGVAKRAREIAEEAADKGEILDEKPVELAVQEMQEHKYRIVETNRNEDEEADEAKELKIEEQLNEESKINADKTSDSADSKLSN
ncbi:MAG TPA: hypothetical protein DHW78_06735 [Ruminococcaceae bacterium]|jgi:DNA-directed RNA polymerase subunit omega|nr:DNA-directed RNA polymerase subunit omega [Oscillospiraceae bacterium]HCA72031.1 hypothetical protein [Oscillospiraceae bacterium]HCC02142.1 hypothetical protein [Oscillospiraceae bacterium]HCM23999.1 hypothetical protein [Oscillospiraceae bacterium]